MQTKERNNPTSPCSLCPRMCGADRSRARGYCGASADIEVSKIMLHRWEEPCISGSRGSGAVFFTHCPLGCVYCQNGKISARGSVGKTYTADELADAILELEREGAHNVNFVSPTQYTLQIIEAVRMAKERGLTIPVVWNTGGYELSEVIKSLGGTVDIFLTDFKYASTDIAERYSAARDYPEYAEKSLRAMYSVVGECVFDESGMMNKGVIVRHLVLPSHRNDSISVLRRIAEAVPADRIILSLMAQYTHEFLPPAEPDFDRFAKIRRKITTFEYDAVLNEANALGFNGFAQDRSSAVKNFTPDF